MKATRKYLRFEQMRIQLATTHPKDVSRAIMCFRDEEGKVFKTSKYGEVTDTTIQWNDAVQILYTNQEFFKFETHCEHEYGYEINELEALYNGQVYIKTQNFFRPLTVHVFSDQGQKCGILKYMTKVIEREVSEKAKSKPASIKEEPTVKVDMIAKVSLYAATMNVNTPLFKKEKYVSDFTLVVDICGQKVQGTYKKNYEWSFQGAHKIEYMEDSPDNINITLKQGQNIILTGHITMGYLRENRRFVTHSIPLSDQTHGKIAMLAIDLRYISKQEVLDLLYSPTKLSGPSPPKHSEDLSKSRLNKLKSNSTSMMTHKKDLQRKQKMSHSRAESGLLQGESRAINRYKKVLMNNSNEIIIPRAKRFSEKHEINPNISYSDPSKLSDFYCPPRYGPRGYNFCQGRKVDFSIPFKSNPGPGQYHLPSIWDKY